MIRFTFSEEAVNYCWNCGCLCIKETVRRYLHNLEDIHTPYYELLLARFDSIIKKAKEGSE